MSGSVNIAVDTAQNLYPMVYANLTEGREDYDYVRTVLEFIGDCGREMPSLEMIAGQVGLGPVLVENLFQRWAGLSADEFLESTSIHHARDMLQGSASLLEIADVLGLSGPASLHDIIVSHKSLPPAEYKKLGKTVEMKYGFHDCPFGIALVVCVEGGVCGIGFCDSEAEQDELLEDMQKRWANAEFVHCSDSTEGILKQIFTPHSIQAEQPLEIILIGSSFEIKVWEALLKVPVGRAVTYSDLAEHIGSPGAHRAIGSAVGRNPISLVVPCHRVLRKDASLGGYHWGIMRKQAILGWEAGKLKAEMVES